jgi:hypothetical protein
MVGRIASSPRDAAADQSRIAGEPGQQDLERHDPASLDLLGAVDVRHPASQPLGDAVAAVQHLSQA